MSGLVETYRRIRSGRTKPEAESWRDTEMHLLGHPIAFWIKIRYVLDLFDIKDADQLAFKLRSRGNKPANED